MNRSLILAAGISLLTFLFGYLPAVSQSVPTLAESFYTSDNIHEIKVYVEADNWDEILDQNKQKGEGDRIPARVVLDGNTIEKAGIRYKGNSSYFNLRNKGKEKLPFNIEADFEIDDQTFAEDVETLKLSNVFRDPSFLREVLSYEIAGKYMPAPRASYAKLYINDRYFGLYNLSQSVDDFFLKHYFGDDDGTLLKCDPAWHSKPKPGCPPGDKASLMYLGDNPACYTDLYELKSDRGWSDLIELTKVLNQAPEQIDTILDVNTALWMLAFNSVLVNLDSYTGRLCHNYYLFKHEDEGSVFVPIVWDMNLSFGGFRFAGLGRSLTTEQMQTLSPFIHYKTKNEKRPLITNLLGVDLYRKMYAGHIRTILEENFVNGAYLQRMEGIRSVIDEEVKNDPLKLYDYEGFQTNWKTTAQAGRAEIVGIEELMEARTEYLMNHSVVGVAPPPIDTIKYLKVGDEIAIQAVIQGAEKAYLAYRTDEEAPFVRVPMFDDGGHLDETAEDNVWACILDFDEDIQYYVIAEGERTASFSPSRAGLLHFHVLEGDLE